MSAFEIAARKKFRFPSIKGDLTVEQLWDLPLIASPTTRDVKADLDTIARGINTELRSISEESFVAMKADPRKADLEVKLGLVKHIIAVKLKEAEAVKASAERADMKRKLTEALAAKKDQAIASMSEEDIRRMLAEIDAGADHV